MYAIVALGGKQYVMEEGKHIRVEGTRDLFRRKEGDHVDLSNVLMVKGSSGSVLCVPELSGAFVKAKILGFGKGEKIRVETYRRRKGKRRTLGHRQPYVHLLIEEIKA